MKFLLVIGVVLILAARNGLALECKVCDEGDIAYIQNPGDEQNDDIDDYSPIHEKPTWTKYHFVEELCSESTPLTTCEDQDDVCVTYKINYATVRYVVTDYNYLVNVQLYRCGRESDLTAHCQEYDEWHDEQYAKYKSMAEDDDYVDFWKGADVKTCEPEITKRGKYSRT